MIKASKSEAAILRQKAKEILIKKPSKSGLHLSEAEMLKLIQELEVNQIELQLWNEELVLAKEKAERLTAEKESECLANVVDISLRKQQEMTRAQLLHILESSLNEIYVFDSVSLVFDYVNLGALCNLGYTMEAMLGMTPVDLKPEFTEESFRNAIAPLLRHEQSQLFFNTVHRRADGSLYPVEVYLQLVEHEGHQIFLALIMDITERKLAESALRNSEIHLRTLVQTIPDLIWLKDPDGVYLSCNTMFERFIGAREADIIGKTDYDFVDRELADFFRENDRKAMEAGKPTSNEEWVTFADDGYRAYLDTIKTPMYDSDGTLIGVLGIGRDITIRMQAVESLKKQKDEFETIFNLVPAQIWYKDTHNNFIRVNQQVCKDIGLSNDQIEGRSAEELFPSFAQQYFKDDLEVFNSRKPKFGIDEQTNTATGVIRWVHTNKFPIFGNDGEVNGLIAFIQDITERKRAEEKLIIANEELAFQNEEKEKRSDELTIANKELTFQNNEKEKRADELTIANKELTFQNEEKVKRAAELVIANKELAFQNEEKEKRAAELIIANKELAFQNEEKEKRAAELIIANEELTFQNNEKEKRADELTIANKELTFQNNEKEKRAAELIIANKELAFQNEEKVKRADELILAKEKAEESDRLKSAFLANMSHEVRTPLNSIIGFSELLADPYFDEDQKNEFIQHIVSNGRNLLSVISDIMDISKIESDEIKIRKSQINAQKFISTVLDQFVIQAEDKKLELKLILPDNVEKTVIIADAERLKQIFNNLMSNAIKFTSNGSIEIGFQPKGEMVEFFVKDTGIGIPAEYHDTIFERFRQVDTSNTRKYGGNGLGLAICKKLVELMGGKIWLESDPDSYREGKGSAFYFTLPAYYNEI